MASSTDTLAKQTLAPNKTGKKPDLTCFGENSHVGKTY
jgi:hypothetical protein